MAANEVHRPNFRSENRPLILLMNFVRRLVFLASGLSPICGAAKSWPCSPTLGRAFRPMAFAAPRQVVPCSFHRTQARVIQTRAHSTGRGQTSRPIPCASMSWAGSPEHRLPRRASVAPRTGRMQARIRRVGSRPWGVLGVARGHGGSRARWWRQWS